MWVLSGLCHVPASGSVSHLPTLCVELCYLGDLGIPANVIFLQSAVFVFVNLPSKCPTTCSTPESEVKQKMTSLILETKEILQCTDAGEGVSER